MTCERGLERRSGFWALVLVGASLGPLSGAGAAETWMLMGREGGCVSIAEAAARKPEFEGVVAPEDLAQKLRAAGHTVTLNEISPTEMRIVAVEAPDAGIAVIFAPEQACGK